MKNLLKKNQIIITALTIMIAVAGYLNLTKDKTNDVEKDISSQVSESSEYEKFIEDLALKENDAVEASTSDFADISDEDSLSQEVVETNTDEVEQDLSVPGEAILASTTITSSYFSNAKLTREQTRARSKETLMNLIANENVTEEQKQAAIDNIIQMAEIAAIENSTEMLLEAKGFEGVVVSIIDNSVDVVVNAASITTQQVAQIEDIVVRKTGVGTENIVISPVVTEE